MNNLTNILQQLAFHQETLLITAKKKQQILISGEMNPLLTLIAEETKLLKKINQLDQERAALLGEERTLSDVINQQPDGDTKREWASLQQRLQQLLAEIKNINESNQLLLEQSLAFTQFMMEQMLPKSDGSGIYNAKSTAKEKSGSVRLFDAKA
ncbi:flagellar protein FlgN [Bacillus sp. B15-48]|uniref:flagellar protein FlgN n=1 Tax=Bacillus sp. B15-48 TaxID=1548601 RepID=UPI00193FE892|nr:flagellar protein FlgN [Bacillus sp. B15-48]